MCSYSSKSSEPLRQRIGTRSLRDVYPLPPPEIIGRLKGLALSSVAVTGSAEHRVLLLEFCQQLKPDSRRLSIVATDMPVLAESNNQVPTTLEDLAKLLGKDVMNAESSGADEDLLIALGDHGTLRFVNTPDYEAFNFFDGDKEHHI